MNPPRLVGSAVRAVRTLSSSSAGVRVVRAALARDFGFDKLVTAPASARAALEYEPRPVQAKAPRAWQDEAHPGARRRGHRRASHELVSAYREKRLSPSEVLASLEKRIDQGAFGLSVHSPFIALSFERAREAARASTERYTRGEPLSPLDGVPIPLKDEHHVKGLVTRGGTAYRATVESEDAFLVKALDRGGAILYGKTHSTEWGMSPLGINAHYRVPRNPYASDRCAGGSSTGSAVAVALGLATVASGSDGGGSIRIPSAFNGTWGIKPTFLRVGRTGGIFTGSMSSGGPIGQSVRDLAEFLSVACREVDPDDTLSQYAPDQNAGAVEGWLRAPGRGVRGCTIGLPRWLWAQAPAPIAELCTSALAALERQGARLVDVEIEHVEHALAAGALTIGCESMAAVGDDYARHRESFSDDLRVNYEVLASMSARDFLYAARTRAALRRSTAAVLARCDVLALPSTFVLPPLYSLAEDLQAVSDMAAMLGVLRPVFLANLTGLPAGGAPVGLSQGLPVGLQIIGDAWDEASVLAVMGALEREGVGDLPPPHEYFDLLG